MSVETIAGYCRACGKPLDAASMRTFQGTIYCAEHVPVAPGVSGNAAAYDPANPYSIPPNAGPTGYPLGAQSTGAPPVSGQANPGVSPGLAFILGMIPGVGAIYNGQYAKGLMHVVIFGLLISIIEHAYGWVPLISLMIAGFWFYMCFEAYHTAKRRQMGLPVDEFSSLIPLKSSGTGTLIAPVILVAAGVLILLSNLNLLDLGQVLRFWPVALIILGGAMLYSRATGTKADGGVQ
jgi:TM2 domain-containing membrane protein YozV